MRYKNIKTGAIINSPCKIKGENWVEVGKVEEVEETEDAVEEKETEEFEEEVIEEEGIDGITKKEIMQELDAFGIEYNSRAKKEVLYNLMLGK